MLHGPAAGRERKVHTRRLVPYPGRAVIKNRLCHVSMAVPHCQKVSHVDDPTARNYGYKARARPPAEARRAPFPWSPVGLDRGRAPVTTGGQAHGRRDWVVGVARFVQICKGKPLQGSGIRRARRANASKRDRSPVGRPLLISSSPAKRFTMKDMKRMKRFSCSTLTFAVRQDTAASARYVLSVVKLVNLLHSNIFPSCVFIPFMVQRLSLA